MPLPRDDHDSQSDTPTIKEQNPLDRLKRFGITNWHEVLLCIPLGYVDYSRAFSLREALAHADVVGEQRLLSLVVTSRPHIVERPKQRLLLDATDGMLTVRIVVFRASSNDWFRWQTLMVGERIQITGRVQNWNGSIQMVAPAFAASDLIGAIVPKYPKRRGILAEGAMFAASRIALETHVNQTAEEIIRNFHGLSEQQILELGRLKAGSVETILRATHAPGSEEEGLRGCAAMRRLAALSLVINAKRLNQRAEAPASRLSISNGLLHKLAGKLPYPLTEDQRQTIREIVADMASPFPMRRVVSGDVGCGKGLCIMIPALATQALGHLAVILVPNGQLADQFAIEMREYFGHDTNIVVVTASTKTLALESNPILVGTTALLSRLKDGPRPMLLAVDEEQKLSVMQKEALSAASTNYLQATATPIPRTTGLIAHGGLDVSVIRTMPVKKKITSHIVLAHERKRLFDHMRRVIQQGGQVAIVYPLVDDSQQDKKSVIAAASEWEKHFPGLVGVLHGQMKPEEKKKAMETLKAGQQRVAVTSSLVEVGLTFKDLRSLVVVHAERFGASSLHQFRGRVARTGGDGHFFMYLPEAISDESMARLKLVESISDGFVLAEKDAQMRGYGDLVADASRQSGNTRSTFLHCLDLTPSEIHIASQLIDSASQRPGMANEIFESS